MPADTEGVIKYKLDHRSIPLPAQFVCKELISCRQKCFEMGLIGQHPDRYGGIGFGNISCRVGESQAFLVSGSQTGHLPVLQREHFALVTNFQRESNTLTSQGIVKPSSESSTHAFLYSLSDDIGAIIHVHSPELWHYAERSGLPATAESTPYGSVELLTEIESLWQQQAFADCPVLVMLGHVDGLIFFGRCLADTEALLLEHWRQAVA